jgi:hypothetical protein
VSWLISKEKAHIDRHGHLKIDNAKDRSMLKQIRGRIVHVKGDVFKAHPVHRSFRRKKVK